jgi:hypothetical protein
MEQVHIEKSLNSLTLVLNGRAFDYLDETACQEQIADYLDSLKILFEREYSLDTSNRIDFFFPRSGIGLEVKAGKRWSKKEVFRQIERYSSFVEIKGLILATGRAQGLPEVLNDKPVRILSLGLGHL